MRTIKNPHPLNGYTTIYQDYASKTNGSTVDTYFKITRHMPNKGKTYVCYYFANPRPADKRDKREPDVYRWNFRIVWKKSGPILYQHVKYHGNTTKNTEWRECDPEDDFNMFPNYHAMIKYTADIIADHELLFTDPNRR